MTATIVHGNGTSCPRRSTGSSMRRSSAPPTPTTSRAWDWHSRQPWCLAIASHTSSTSTSCPRRSTMPRSSNERPQLAPAEGSSASVRDDVGEDRGLAPRRGVQAPRGEEASGGPHWMLAQQWRMGEFLGDDAASPISTSVSWRSRPIGAPGGARERTDLLEAGVEGEPWVVDMRVRVQAGIELAELIDEATYAACLEAFPSQRSRGERRCRPHRLSLLLPTPRRGRFTGPWGSTVGRWVLDPPGRRAR